GSPRLENALALIQRIRLSDKVIDVSRYFCLVSSSARPSNDPFVYKATPLSRPSRSRRTVVTQPSTTRAIDCGWSFCRKRTVLAVVGFTFENTQTLSHSEETTCHIAHNSCSVMKERVTTRRRLERLKTVPECGLAFDVTELIIVSANLCAFAKNRLAQRRKGCVRWPK